MKMNQKYKWINAPAEYTIDEAEICIVTEPKTDLWQKTYGGDSADNAPMLLWETCDKTFTFTVKVTYESDGLYDQAGIVLHQDENTWMKASMECEGDIKHLGSVVTNRGFSDWASVDFPKDKRVMWYRMNRRESDFLLEYSEDGHNFSVLRMCHIWDLADTINIGLYACSPRESSFKAFFTDIKYESGDSVQIS